MGINLKLRIKHKKHKHKIDIRAKRSECSANESHKHQKNIGGGCPKRELVWLTLHFKSGNCVPPGVLVGSDCLTL